MAPSRNSKKRKVYKRQAKHPQKKQMPLDKDFLSAFHEVVSEALAQAPDSLFDTDPDVCERLANNYVWHGLYDAPFNYCLAAYIHCLIPRAKIFGLLRGDAYRKILNWATSEKLEKEWVRENFDLRSKIAFAATHAVMCKNMLSISLYSRSINAQLDLASSTGEDKYFFDAVRLDPSVIQSRKMSKRIRKAVITDEKEFFNKLGDAIKGKTGKKADYLKIPRLIVISLKETGQLQKMTEKERRELLIDHLRLLSGQSADTEDTFARFIRRQLAAPDGQDSNF